MRILADYSFDLRCCEDLQACPFAQPYFNPLGGSEGDTDSEESTYKESYAVWAADQVQDQPG